MSATSVTVTVVLPWGGNCPHRRRALNWVLGWYMENFAAWTCVVAAGPDGRWCKAEAAMPAIEQCDSDIVVLGDADVFSRAVGHAVDAVSTGTAWAVPHDRVRRLDQASTEQLLQTGEPGSSYVEHPYPSLIGGGLVVARRDVLLEVPLDRRFIGWGQEDDSHGRALRCLHGEPWQGRADLVHLWHPPQERQSRSIGSDESWALRRRYRRARNDPDAMRELLREAS